MATFVYFLIALLGEVLYKLKLEIACYLRKGSKKGNLSHSLALIRHNMLSYVAKITCLALIKFLGRRDLEGYGMEWHGMAWHGMGWHSCGL